MLLGGVLIFQGALIGGVWLILIGMFLRGSAAQGYEQLALTRALESTRVEDVMIAEPVTVTRDLALSEVLSEFFLRYGYRGFPVLDGGRPVGVLSIQEIASVPAEELSRTSVGAVMKPLDSGNTISRSATLLEAMEKLSPLSVGRLLVVEEDELSGMITKTGLVRLLEMRRVLGRQMGGTS
jgi:predicted transcriptional regulator